MLWWWVGCAVAVARIDDASRAVGGVGGVQRGSRELGGAPRAVDGEIGLDHGVGAAGLDGDSVGGSDWLDRRDGRFPAHVDADVGPSCDQQLDEIGVEALEWANATVDDDGAGAGTSSDVRELERDEPAADEEHTTGQVLEVEEVGAVDQALLAGERSEAHTSEG